LDASQFLASVKVRAFVPDAGQELTDAEILRLGDEGLIEVILPAYSAVREGFLQLDQSYTVSGSTYQVPPRAIGGAVMAVRFVDTSGILYPLTRIDDSQRQWVAQLSGPISPATVWYLVGDQIVLQPAPPAGQAGTLLVTYMAQPNQLQLSTATNLILNIEDVDFATSKLTIGVSPLTYFPPGTVADVVAKDGSHGWRVFNTTVTAIHTTAPFTVTLASLPSTCGAVASDILSTVNNDTGYTLYPMIPNALHTLLVLETARRYLDAIADPRADAVAAELEQKAPKILQMVAPRAMNQPKRAINQRSALRTMRARGGWWGGWPGTGY
jgi:hypothetical protein